MIIKDVGIRRIIDSRGNPTVEAEITTENGFTEGTFEGLADKVVTPCKIAWFLTCNPERIFVYIFLIDF